MENQNQNNTGVIFTDNNGTSIPSLPLASNDLQALNSAPVALVSSNSAQATPTVAVDTKSKPNFLVRVAKRADIILAVLLVLGSVGLVVGSRSPSAQERENVNTRFNPTEIPLDDLRLTETEGGVSVNSQAVTINGALVVAPSSQPSKATAGQIYFDQTTHVLSYFDGAKFVSLEQTQEGAPVVQSIGGQSGQITIGSGLSMAEGRLTNSGVLSIQGEEGAVTFTGGSGIGINGTTITNKGVISVTSSIPTLTVTDDGNGNITLSGSGTGTVASPGGTSGVIPVFTGAQTIEDSIVAQSGTIVTVSGDLSVTGNVALGNALTVSNGGTGANSLTLNGVLIGQGTGAITSVAAGGAGLCLLSTAGAPTFAACPGGSGVSSLNGLSGGLTVANASGAGSTITIDNASTSAKGIAQFNSSNFNVGSGVVNTVQDINTTATPSFVAVNTNSISPTAALTVGVSGQTALLQGSTTTITSNGAGNDVILNSADTIELQDNTNVTGNVTASGDVAVNGGDLTSSGALNITPGGALTVGAASQNLTLQGTASTSLRATDAGNTTIVGFVSPTANTTLNFPALLAGTYTICTSSGNCPSASETLQSTYDNSSSPEIVLDATRGALTVRDSVGGLGANLLEVQNNGGSTTYLAVTSTGIAVTGTVTVTGNINSTAGGFQTGGSTRIDSSGNVTNIGNITLSGAISGGTTYSGSGNINTTGGAIQTGGTSRIDNTGNLINIAAITASGSATLQGGTVTLGTSSQAGGVVLNDGSSNTGTLQVAALGQNTVYTLPDPGTGSVAICLTSGNCVGTGGGVTTAGGTPNSLAKFTGAQAIGDSTITDNGTAVTTSVDLVIQGGDATLGVATGQTGTLNFAHSGSSFLGSIAQGALSGNHTYTLPDSTGTFCLTSGNCLGGGGGANTSLSNLTGVAINTALLPGAAGSINLGSGTLPFGDLFLAGSSGTPATNNFRITGASTGGTRVITLPDATGTICLQSSTACGFAPTTGSTSYIQNQIAVDQSADFRISGDGRAATFNATTGINTGAGAGTQRIDATGNLTNVGNIALSGAISGGTTFTGSGNVNTTGGGLQTNSITRVSNSGDLTNIGNLTAAGGITIASSGAGNDIVINGADILDIQDATTFASGITANGDLTVNGTNSTLGDANTDTLTVNAVIQGGSPLIFEGGTADEHELTIAIATLTGDQTITFPDASGTVCISTGNCSGSGSTNTLQAAYEAGNTLTTITARNIAFTLADSATDSNFSVTTASNATGFTTFARADGSGTVDPAQLVLIDNLEADRTQPVGLKLQATFGMTTAIDASDNEIGTALNIGANTLQGTTADIDLTNFDVVGASGNTTVGGTLTVNNNTTITGGAADALVVKSSGNGTGVVVLNLQQSDTDSVLRMTDTGTLAIGNATNVAGIFAIGNGSGNDFVEIKVDNVTASQTIQLPNASGTMCLSSGNCTSTDTLQTAYTASTGGTTPEIKLDTARNGIEIQDANTTIGSGQNFISLRGPNASGLGTVLFGVGTQGNLYMMPSTNRVDLVDINQNSSGTASNVFTIDSLTSTGRVGIALTSTNNPAYTLDVGGDTNLASGSTFRINGTAICTSSGCTPAAGSSNYIQNQSVSDQSASFRISGTGMISSASATAFQVLNGSTVPQFSVDSSASRVYVGNPSADATGALLVLDTKNDTGDPTATGLGGAMYYSSFYKSLRCYEDGAWRYCNEPMGLSKGYNIMEDFIGTSTSSTWGSNGWQVSGQTPTAQQPDAANRAGQLELTTDTSTTGVGTIYLGGAAFTSNVEPIRINGGETVEFAINVANLSDATNEFDVRAGLCDQDASCDDGLYFEYDRNASVNWRYAAANGSGTVENNSSVAVATGWVRFKIVVNNAGTSAEYFIDGTSVGTIATNIPTGSGDETQAQFTIAKSAGTTARTMRVDYFQFRSSFTTQR